MQGDALQLSGVIFTSPNNSVVLPLPSHPSDGPFQLEWLSSTVSSLLEGVKSFLEAALGALTDSEAPTARRDGSLAYVSGLVWRADVE